MSLSSGVCGVQMPIQPAIFCHVTLASLRAVIAASCPSCLPCEVQPYNWHSWPGFWLDGHSFRGHGSSCECVIRRYLARVVLLLDSMHIECFRVIAMNHWCPGAFCSKEEQGMPSLLQPKYNIKTSTCIMHLMSPQFKTLKSRCMKRCLWLPDKTLEQMSLCHA